MQLHMRTYSTINCVHTVHIVHTDCLHRYGYPIDIMCDCYWMAIGLLPVHCQLSLTASRLPEMLLAWRSSSLCSTFSTAGAWAHAMAAASMVCTWPSSTVTNWRIPDFQPCIRLLGLYESATDTRYFRGRMDRKYTIATRRSRSHYPEPAIS